MDDTIATTRQGVELAHGDISKAVIGAYYDVFNGLARRVPEVLYQRGMGIALRDRGLVFEREVPLEVRFRGSIIGHYRADLIVEGKILVETKCVDRLAPAHERQVYGYLAMAGLRVGLLFNFGDRPTFRRLLLASRPSGVSAAGWEGAETDG